jgi:hypothetical protein
MLGSDDYLLLVENDGRPADDQRVAERAGKGPSAGSRMTTRTSRRVDDGAIAWSVAATRLPPVEIRRAVRDLERALRESMALLLD